MSDKEPFMDKEYIFHPNDGDNYRHRLHVLDDGVWALTYEEYKDGAWKTLTELSFQDKFTSLFAKALLEISNEGAK